MRRPAFRRSALPLVAALAVLVGLAPHALAAPHGHARRGAAGSAAIPPRPAAPAANAPTTTDARDAVGRALAFAVTIDGGGSYGAGILVDPARGMILTARHVIDGMASPRVTFSDGAEVPGRVVADDRDLDVALVEVAPQPRRSAPLLGDATALRPGDEVYAVGCPRHLAFTVSRGIVSFVGRMMEGARYIQTDLAINDGNSGGPVINARGELVGMMSFILRRGEGLAFALPVAYAAERFPSVAGIAQGGETLARFREWSRR